MTIGKLTEKITTKISRKTMSEKEGTTIGDTTTNVKVDKKDTTQVWPG